MGAFFPCFYLGCSRLSALCSYSRKGWGGGILLDSLEILVSSLGGNAFGQEEELCLEYLLSNACGFVLLAPLRVESVVE